MIILNYEITFIQISHTFQRHQRLVQYDFSGSGVTKYLTVLWDQCVMNGWNDGCCFVMEGRNSFVFVHRRLEKGNMLVQILGDTKATFNILLKTDWTLSTGYICWASLWAAKELLWYSPSHHSLSFKIHPSGLSLSGVDEWNGEFN